MRSRINKIFGMSRVTSKGSAPELVKRETDTLVTYTVDALKHSETLCAITMRYMEIGKSSRIDDKVVQDQRQRDDYDLQDERQDQPKEEEEIGKSSKIDDKVVKDQRQRDDYDIQDERKDQPNEE
ncbi:hypothetical protein Tco_1007319 [Tanacetum coccineum]